MAMGKNRTGIMAAITAAAEATASTENQSGMNRGRAYPSLPKGTVGSVRASAGGVQEIAAEQILPWGPRDRLSFELTAVNPDTQAEEFRDLIESIRLNGQQVPVLLRPAVRQDGFFEVVYGRRRIQACASLGVSVKAIIRAMDDVEALMAKGLENAGRVDLSYYERARFAAEILALGYAREQVQQAMAISKTTLSQLERISRLVPGAVGESVGPAPQSGRPKWMALAAAFEKGQIEEARALQHLAGLDARLGSDERLDALLREITHRGVRARGAEPANPAPGVTIRSGQTAITVSVARAQADKGYADWLDLHLSQIIRDSYERFRQENAEE